MGSGRERGDWAPSSERERALVPQRDRLSHGRSAGSLPERAAAAHRQTHRGRAARTEPERVEGLCFSACQDLLTILMTMPGWRRNLTFCLQRMHEEGKKPKQNQNLGACAYMRAWVHSLLKCEQFVSGDTLQFPLHVFRVFWITGSACVSSFFAHVSCSLTERHLQLW